MADANRPTPGEITILAAGVVALVSSFLDFYTFGDNGANAWSSGLFPLAGLMVIFVVLMAFQISLTRFAHMEITSRPFGFTWLQIHLALAFFATVNAVAFLLTRPPFGTSRGIGFWGILVACVAALFGAVLLQKEVAGRAGPNH